MKALSLFLPYVLPYAYGCSDPMAEQAVLNACIEFCARSHLVQNVQAEDAVAGQSDYDVEIPPSMSPVRVLAVYFGTRRLASVSREMVQHAVAVRGEAVGGVTITSGTPQEWFARNSAGTATYTVGVYPPPSEASAGAISILAAHQPARTATTVADVLYDLHAADIAAGAIAQLLAMPNQPFSAPSAAASFRAQFNTAVGSAATVARVGRAVAHSFVQPRPFT